MTPEAHEVLEGKIIKIVAATLGFQDAEVDCFSELSRDLNADSLDMVELVMALEEEFDIEIPDEDAEVVNAVGDIVGYIANRVPDFTVS